MPYMTVEVIEAILTNISYPGAKFVLRTHSINPYLQVEIDGCCNLSGVPVTWRGRKWGLSFYMTKSEIVQTAFLAMLTAVEHEVREKFKYRDQAVFGPHFDIEQLVTLASNPNSQDVRPEPPQQEPPNETHGVGIQLQSE